MVACLRHGEALQQGMIALAARSSAPNTILSNATDMCVTDLPGDLDSVLVLHKAMAIVDEGYDHGLRNEHDFGRVGRVEQALRPALRYYLRFLRPSSTLHR
jgi:hypothetical protein